MSFHFTLDKHVDAIQCWITDCNTTTHTLHARQACRCHAALHCRLWYNDTYTVEAIPHWIADWYNNTYYDWKCTAIKCDHRSVLRFTVVAVCYSMLPVILQQTTARDAAISTCTAIRCNNEPCRSTLLWLSFSFCDPLCIHYKLLLQ